MKNKFAIIVQSYEELPYLVWLIDKNNTDTFTNCEFSIYSFGGSDFWKHLNKLFQNKKIKLVDLSLQSENLYNSKKIQDRIKYYFYLKFKIQNSLNINENIIFFTPFCVPHLSRILSLYENKKVYFVPIPVLQLKGYINNNLHIVPIEISSVFKNFKFNFRLLRLKFFFGKNISLAQLGPNLEPILSKNILNNFNLIGDLFKKENISNYDDYYLEKNYISNLEIFRDEQPSLVFFDQHYVERKIVNFDKYYKLIFDIFNIFEKKGFKCFHKSHPDVKQNKSKKFPNFVSTIPSYVPAEFISKNNIIAISITSGAIANNLYSKICISLINLIPFKNIDFKHKAFELLKRKTKVRIFCPKDINEIETLLDNKEYISNLSAILGKDKFIAPSTSSN